MEGDDAEQQITKPRKARWTRIDGSWEKGKADMSEKIKGGGENTNEYKRKYYS